MMVVLKRPTKILLLIAGLLPIIFAITFIIFLQLGILANYDDEPTAFGYFVNFEEVPSIIVLFWVAFISVPCMLIFYIIDVWRKNRVANNQKALWTVVLFAGLWLAFPVYWYLYIWRKPKINTLGQVSF